MKPHPWPLTIIRLSPLIACIFLIAVASAKAEDWPKWRGPRGNGTWQGPNISADWPDKGLEQRWKKSIGGGYAGVVVQGNRLILFDYVKQPSEQERVRCYNTQTGDVLWTAAYDVKYGDLDYGTGPRAAPTIVDDRIYTLGAIGHLHCLNLTNGEVIWESHLVDKFNGRLAIWGYAASPMVFDNLLIVAPGGKQGHSIFALNPETGETIWHSLSDEAGYTSPILVKTKTEQRLIFWTPSHIRGLSLPDGKPLWDVPYKVSEGVSIATPIIHRNIVVVAGYWHGSKAIRLGEKPTDAELIWEDERQLRGLMSQPLYRDGLVYLLDKRLGLTCFEIETGKKLWDDKNKMTPRGRNPQASMVWVGETGNALVLNSDGELILARFDARGYHELARSSIIGHTWAHPAYAGEFVYARSDTELVCVKLPVIP